MTIIKSVSDAVINDLMIRNLVTVYGRNLTRLEPRKKRTKTFFQDREGEKVDDKKDEDSLTSNFGGKVVLKENERKIV